MSTSHDFPAMGDGRLGWFPWRQGDMVCVRRSNGSLETNWVIKGISADGGLITVEKSTGDSTIKKDLTREEFDELNSDKARTNADLDPASVDSVRHNLEMLKDPLNLFLAKESRGGNASSVEVEGVRYQCIAANGFLDPVTGRILGFTNREGAYPQGVRFQLRLAVDNIVIQNEKIMPNRGFFLIVECNLLSQGLSPEARKVLDRMVIRYNKAKSGSRLL